MKDMLSNQKRNGFSIGLMNTTKETFLRDSMNDSVLERNNKKGYHFVIIQQQTIIAP